MRWRVEVERHLGGPDRLRAVTLDLGDDFFDPAQQLGRRHRLVGEPDLGRLLTRVALAQEDHLLGAPFPAELADVLGGRVMLRRIRRRTR